MQDFILQPIHSADICIEINRLMLLGLNEQDFTHRDIEFALFKKYNIYTSIEGFDDELIIKVRPIDEKNQWLSDHKYSFIGDLACAYEDLFKKIMREYRINYFGETVKNV